MHQQFCKFQLHPKYSFLFQLNHFILCIKNKNIIHIAMFPIRILMLKRPIWSELSWYLFALIQVCVCVYGLDIDIQNPYKIIINSI